jgi:hypothetical protein
MFSARRGQDLRRDRYEPLVTVAHAPSSLSIYFQIIKLPSPSSRLYIDGLFNDAVNSSPYRIEW